MDKIFFTLIDILENNRQTSLQAATELIDYVLKKIGAPQVKIKERTYIERAVKIDCSQGKFGLDRLSFIPNKLKDQVKEGRFNNKAEPLFYGAFTNHTSPGLTRYFLACEIEQNIAKNICHDFRFTISKWQARRPFTAITFLYDENYCKDEQLRAMYENCLLNPTYINFSIDIKQALKAITRELARKDSTNGYMFSNLIFDFYKRYGYTSILYPSVQANYEGINIAILPKSFDDTFSFFRGIEVHLKQEVEDIRIENKYEFTCQNHKLIYKKITPENEGKIETYYR